MARGDAQYRLRIFENWAKKPTLLSFATPAHGGFSPAQVERSIVAEMTPGSEFWEALQQGSIRPEIWAIEAGSTKNHNIYTAKRLLSGKPDEDGYPSGVASWSSPFGKPILTNHDIDVDPLGRIRAPEDAKYARRNGNAGILLYPTLTQPEAIGKVVRGEYLTGSIGSQTDAALCTICGHDIVATRELCDHVKGRRYNQDGEQDPKGDRMCAWELGNLWFQEYSFVNQPAKSSSAILQVDTRERFEESISRSGEIVFSGEKADHKTVCYGCVGEEGECLGVGECETQPQEAFYVIKLHKERRHFWIPDGWKESAGMGTIPTPTNEEDASMPAKKVVYPAIPEQEMIEAKLSTKKRKALPDSAFCGPNRSYPAHDASHVRNGLARLAQHGGRYSSAVRSRILACLRRKAKQFGVKTSNKKESEDKQTVTIELVDVTGDKAVEWVDSWCESNGLTEDLKTVKAKSDEDWDTVLQSEWAESETDSVKEGEREELKAHEDFLADLEEGVFCGPNRSFPVFTSFGAQTARAMLAWPSTREKLTVEQRGRIMNAVAEQETRLDDKGLYPGAEGKLPKWFNPEEFVMIANMQEDTIHKAKEGFGSEKQTGNTNTGEGATGDGCGCGAGAEELKKVKDELAAAEAKIEDLTDTVAVRDSQIEQLNGQISTLQASEASLQKEVTELQEQNSKLGADVHKDLVEKLVKTRVGAGSKRTEEELREQYTKLPIDSLKHLLEDLQSELGTSDNPMPAARPATESGDAPAGNGVKVDNASGGQGDKPNESSKAVRRFVAAAVSTGALAETPKDQS